MGQSRQSVRNEKRNYTEETCLYASIRKHLATKPQTPNVYTLHDDKIGQQDDAKHWGKQQSVGLYNVLQASGKWGQSMAIIVQQS